MGRYKYSRPGLKNTRQRPRVASAIIFKAFENTYAESSLSLSLYIYKSKLCTINIVELHKYITKTIYVPSICLCNKNLKIENKLYLEEG